MTREADQPGIGVGTWAWGNQFLWGYDPKRDDGLLEQTFQRCLELDFRFFDTADSYGTGRLNGRSELLLGRFAMQASTAQRQQLCIATKLAPFPWRLGRHGYAKAFAASQRRLQGQMKRVQLHWSTARYAPWQEPALIDGLADLVERGEVASLGLSNMGPKRLRTVHRQLQGRGIPISSLQVQFSLLAPQPLEDGGIITTCRELGIELIAYSPLALGLLGRSAGDPRQVPKGTRGNLFRRLETSLSPLRQTMTEIAANRPGGLAAVAMNWCRAHGAMPIPGLRTPKQVEQAAAARSWSLTGEERAALDRLALMEGAARMPANPFQSA
ncbi:aldo/keto reductase [Synechococcus sp. A10-1-5-1]|uniref:aldo/keto reductase n=1 Tax=Synechococcus sp. A10-1-5-1 TaxID=2936507 RepID=UPI002001C1F8|nr:aldo/keto reductase [Synechococcus sp. A10-1-5-1]UPM51380.1 aldo/keto reductase [Synechococcus sp. A10-1-5-1]